MCGIAGFVDAGGGLPGAEFSTALRRMTQTLVHRGPDDAGEWIDPAARVALGHRRLSIVDLSPQGHQPMLSSCGRYVATYNGELYNYKALRSRLEAHSEQAWRGTSDTEVMLAAITQWGLNSALEHFTGMFAFALWDRHTQTLSLVRDRIGEKPLYYGWVGSTFCFASELKAFRGHPSWEGQIDRRALTLYVRYGYIPAPFSIYHNVFKVPPASIVNVDRSVLEGLTAENASPLPSRQYWSAVRTRGQPELADASTAEQAAGRLKELLSTAVADQMVADVPVGAFLSGGIDSSTVVAVMQSLSTRPVRTFTIGFLESAYNEAKHAKAVATAIGTDHTELYVTPSEVQDVIPKLPEIYDEPFGDSSQIPTYLVARLARSQVTVSLSGDGGDELFGGYPRYLLAERLWRYSRSLPSGLRRWAAGTGECGLNALNNVVPAPASARLPRVLQSRIPSRERLLRLMAATRAETAYGFYQYFLSHTRDATSLVLGAENPLDEQPDTETFGEQTLAHFLYFDLVGYLPNDILVKVDRAAMASSLETRIPLLDHRIVEFAQRLPLKYKINRGVQKWLLRQVLYQYLPKSLVERPKMGFGIPVASWLRGSLRQWAESLLEENGMAAEGLLDSKQVQKMWRSHLSGADYWQHALWDILMFQSWYRAQKTAQEAAVD